MAVSGVALARGYLDDAVAPLLAARRPGLAYAAGRLGGGSEVLGYDDDVSHDHDWGPQLTLLVPPDLVSAVDDDLARELPETFRGHPVRFATTWDGRPRHRVHVDTVESFVRSRTGLAATAPWSVADWLALTGQSVLEVVAGPVFVDRPGQLTEVRRRLTWYPDDLWLHVVAVDWARIAQELPFVGRTAQRGDDLGSRVVAARLAGTAMHLAHLLERRWPPYAKWIGTSLTRLPHARAVATPLRSALAAADGAGREDHLVAALRVLNDVQRRVGLPAVDDPVEPFFARDSRGVRREVVARLEEAVTDPEVRALPRGVGSIEQRSDNVDVLMDRAGRGPG